MKRIWIVFLTVLITGVIVGGGVYYYEKQKIDSNKSDLQRQIDVLNTKISDQTKTIADLNTAATTETVTPTTATATDTSTAWKTYTNTTYDFSLTFTDSWKGYTVYEKAGDGNAVKYLYFQMPTTDKNWAPGTTATAGNASVFAVAVYTTSSWATELAELQANGLDVTTIGKNSDYVFTGSPAQDLPSDLRLKSLSANTVLATLKATN